MKVYSFTRVFLESIKQVSRPPLKWWNSTGGVSLSLSGTLFLLHFCFNKNKRGRKERRKGWSSQVVNSLCKHQVPTVTLVIKIIKNWRMAQLVHAPVLLFGQFRSPPCLWCCGVFFSLFLSKRSLPGVVKSHKWLKIKRKHKWDHDFKTCLQWEGTESCVCITRAWWSRSTFFLIDTSWHCSFL